VGADVTIGIPVYNGAATLRRAVESALAQTHPAVVHISDNASTDATAEIGQALAAEHGAAVRYTRHAAGLGSLGNFGFLLRQAETEYFMWLAADDYILPTYVERMLRELEADPGVVASVSQVLFVRADDGATRLAAGTFPLLSDDPASNLAAFLSDPSDNSRAFGVYRTRALLAAFPPRMFHGYDWAYTAGTLLHGKHMEVPEILMIRDETPSEAYTRIGQRENASALGRQFPVLAVTADLVRRQRIPVRWAVLKALLRINLEKHREYAFMFHPRYGRAISPLLQKYVLWRLESPRPSGIAAPPEAAPPEAAPPEAAPRLASGTMRSAGQRRG
jgi:glycosyltransferase involved in cell wall biosynthesis